MKDQVCIITGASQGTGKAIARALFESGARVVLVSRSEARLAAVRDEMGIPETVWACAADVTRPGQVDGLVQKILQQHGRIDLLVNNVGGGLKKELVETSNEDWQHLLEVNLTSTFNCCRAVLPVMRQQRAGTIINIASKAGRVGEGEFAAYCAAKHGVVGLTRALADSEGQYGIRVNAICPGPIATEKMIALYPEEDRAAWSTPEDVANTVLYLSSPAGHAMQGKTVDLY
ncbi:MAG: SDR family oxidoreductase [Anaerolineaceae bacterium]|nr:SDR family oxidoreductase [Anaerolineaceae bacterium]